MMKTVGIVFGELTMSLQFAFVLFVFKLTEELFVTIIRLRRVFSRSAIHYLHQDSHLLMKNIR